MSSIPDKDREVLRRLGARKAEIAALPIQDERRELWRRLNSLEPVKPPIHIREVPWQETEIPGQLACENKAARGIERGLRMEQASWDICQGDMIVNGVIYVRPVVHSTGFGLSEESERIHTYEGSVASRRFIPQIVDEADIEKIKNPVLTLDEEATSRQQALLEGIFDGVLPVERRGQPGMGFAPWDRLVTWWGVEQAMMDLVLRPKMVKAAISRLVDAQIADLEQREALGVLAVNNRSDIVGSGGYGTTDELPRDGAEFPAKLSDMWGSATPQIFSEISPAMHEEFALSYERRWLDRFGLTYYGCCEPLHHKIDILRKVPNLRKISMAPKADMAVGAEAIGTDYVISHKPNPAILAETSWSLDRARQELRDALDAARGCVVEVILKDISTIYHEPHRLKEWAAMAVEETERVAGG